MVFILRWILLAKKHAINSSTKFFVNIRWPFEKNIDLIRQLYREGPLQGYSQEDTVLCTVKFSFYHIVNLSFSAGAELKFFRERVAKCSWEKCFQYLKVLVREVVLTDEQAKKSNKW